MHYTTEEMEGENIIEEYHNT